MSELYVISGAAGMTGSELVHQLIKRGDYVVGFDNFFASSIKIIEDMLADNHFFFFEGDINDKKKMKWLEELVREKRKHYSRLVYINCAAVVHTEHFYHVERTFETNVLGMKSFLEQAILLNAEIYINCSTSEVYSMESYREGGVKEEDYILMATAEHSQRTSYAAGKLLTEFFMKDAVDRKKIKGCSLRFANVYSKNERLSKHIIPHIITSLLTDGTVTLLENSRVNRRTFLHNIDSCRAVTALIDCEPALDGTVYNVATMEEITMVGLVGLCAEAIGLEAPVIRFEGYRQSDPERRLLSSEKLEQRTGWKPVISLRDGIDMCVKWHKGQRDGVQIS